MNKFKSVKSLFTIVGLLAGLASLTVAAAWADSFKPSDIYKEYLHRVYYAKSLDPVIPYFNKRARGSFYGMTAQEKDRALEKLKKSYIGKFEVMKEDVVGDMAFIEAKGYAKDWGQVTKAKVHVEMIRESGAWKIRHHAWKGKVNPPKGRVIKKKSKRKSYSY